MPGPKHKPPTPTPSALPRGGPLYAIVGVVGFAAAAAWYSHYAQKRDKAIMRAGVERDKERLKLLRQRQNAAQLHGGGEGAASTS